MSHATGVVEKQPNGLSTEQLIEQIQRVVRRNSWRWKLLTLLEGIGLAVSALLAYLWVVFWLDNILRFPMAGRILASLGLFICLGFLGAYLRRRWQHLHFTEDQVALAIERRTPQGVQNRLINALQIARSSTDQPTPLTRAVIEENVSRIQQFKLEQAAALKPALVRLVAAALLVSVGCAFYFWRPDYFTNAATRILLPFGDVDPLYRTKLVVQPGDTEAVGDIPLRIEIQGERPAYLTLYAETDGKRRTESIAVPPGTTAVEYTLQGVHKTMQYAVRGNDYTSPYYQITVPRPSLLNLLKCSYHFPEYTGLDDKQTESGSAEIQALRGTKVDFELVLDQPCEKALLLVDRAAPDAGKNPSAHTPPAERLTLQSKDPTTFQGSMTLDDQTSFRIVTQQPDRSPYTSAPYAIHVVPDEAPALTLTGLDATSEAAVDASISLQASASDDFGLDKVGLFSRRPTEQTPAAAPSSLATSSPATEISSSPTNDWQPLHVWSVDGKTKWNESYDLTLLTLDVAEGEVLEIALRATDRDPHKANRWTDGVRHQLKIGGDAAALQLVYEQILRTETELTQITTDQRKLLAAATEWTRKLDGDGKLDWKDPKNIQALHDALAQQTQQQSALRDRASRAARSMVAQAGSLRMSLAMLADTELVRALRIYESVPTRDDVIDKRTALADLQITDERLIGSLQKIAEQYQRFRQEWELNHMIDFVEMLAERQVVLRDTSLQNVDRPSDALSDRRQASAARRQEKLRALIGLSQTACQGLGGRLREMNSQLAEAFAKAANDLAGTPLTQELQLATTDIQQGKWTTAAEHQAKAADQLRVIHTDLRKAQTAAAQQVLEALEELNRKDLAAQQEIEKLRAGNATATVKLPEQMTIKDVIHMQELIAESRKGSGNAEAKVTDYLLTDEQIRGLPTTNAASKQPFDVLKLGKTAGDKSPRYPKSSDRASNEVTAPIQKEFEDLVGDLLEEADEISDKYDTYNINAAFQINEQGDVGKQGGDLNSTAASAATGNKKPPVNDFGGASRIGRQGARAHGMAVGDESINRKGRDEVLEGDERVPDQEGRMKETMSDNPQSETSTGVGGKKVDSKDTQFSLADKGKWDNDMLKRLDRPQDKQNIVERQGDPIDAKTAEMFRDMTSDHEQIIERVKAIRKELKNLYLPTDHIDEILAELNGQLDQMKERPSAEIFRSEQQTLDKLRGALRVFQQASAGFQPSLPREQAVRGHVLDEADRPAPPGYEKAVKAYYEKMSLGTGP